MFVQTTVVFLLCALSPFVGSQTWNITDGVRPWEMYLQLGEIQRPLGLALNRSSPAHYHFSIGYLCLHSFMYDEAQEAFNIAISLAPTFIEPYIGKILACKQALWSYTDLDCGQAAYNVYTNLANRPDVIVSTFQRTLAYAASLWYSNRTSVSAGENAFYTWITNISNSFPNETDIQVLRGLSLLNLATQYQYQAIIEPQPMLDSRPLLKAALQNEPNHPGTLHYLIHAYDVNRVDTAEQGRPYALAYGSLVPTTSHGQHMPAHIWLRTGSWNLALSADSTAILASLSLCACEFFNRSTSLPFFQLDSVLNLLNISTTNQTISFIQCDDDNRGHSTEWLSYYRLQVGDWPGSIALLRDLYLAYDQTSSVTRFYLPFAQRAHTRATIELFAWFPYKAQFVTRMEQLFALNRSQTEVSVSDNETDWFPIWSEAGFRFSECLRLLTAPNATLNSSVVNDHLARFPVLANRTAQTNLYVSNNILTMINQVRAVRAYVNQSLQECLNELNAAVQREMLYPRPPISPTLIFTRSSELLATHLLLMHERFQQQSGRALASTYSLNGTDVAVGDFPSRALTIYQTSNSTDPNRAISLLGLARSYTRLQNYAEAARLYRVLLVQLNSSNTTDTTFLQEVYSSLNQFSQQNNAATHHGVSLSFSFMFFILYHW